MKEAIHQAIADAAAIPAGNFDTCLYGDDDSFGSGRRYPPTR